MKRWTRRILFRRFMAGASMERLARIYGLNVLKVESVIRDYRSDAKDLKWFGVK